MAKKKKVFGKNDEIRSMDGQFWDSDVIQEVEDFGTGRLYMLDVLNRITGPRTG